MDLLNIKISRVCYLLNLVSFIFICFLYFYGSIMLYVSFLARKKGERSAFIDNFTNSLVLIISISISLLLVSYLNPSNVNFIVFPFDLLMIIFVLIFFPLFSLLIYREKRIMRKKLGTIKKNSSSIQIELPLKYDIYRKLSHLVVLAIILFYFTLGFLVQNFFIYLLDFLPEFFTGLFYSIYNIEKNKMIFTQYLVIYLVGISLIGLLTADFVRILKPEIYPLKPINQILREKEKQTHMRIGPQISLAIGCFSIIILYGLIQPLGPLIICTSMTMAIFGDMASNLVGRTIGDKFKNIRDTKKTYIGLFAGITGSFLSGILILFLLREFFTLSIFYFVIFPLIGALIIGIIDYLDLEINDNLSFNFVTTSLLFFISLFLL